MNDKTDKLFERIASFADAALIFSETNRFYFTGFAASDVALLVYKKGALFFTDSRYTEAACRKLGETFVRDSKTLFADLRALFDAEGIRTVALENDRLTLAEYETVKKELPAVQTDISDRLCEAVTALRMVKSPEEIEKTVAAQRIAERAFDHILPFIRPGVTEKEIALELEYFMLRNGADGLSFETIAVSGVNSSLPHGVPGDKKIESGDFITMDYGALKDGYHSDMTRTVALGHVSEKQKQIYQTVLAAQQASLAFLKDGVSGFDADKQARDVIEKAGFGAYFGHGTGHGTGVEIHEQPRLSPQSKRTLHTGNIVTVEPGIYLPGEFGVRIEDMALITEEGCVNLTACPKELIIL